MSLTHDVGPFYFHTMPYPKEAPRVERAFTSEIESPYREGNGICIRIGLKAFIFGKWGKINDALAEEWLDKLEARPGDFSTETIRSWPKVGDEVLQ